MYPDPCPSKATAGERRVYELLRRCLPDEYVVWFEANVEGRYPDFTILGVRMGLLVLEVKDWTANKIVRADPERVEVRCTRSGQEKVEARPHPLRQARDYMMRAKNRLEAEPLLCREWGAHRGNLAFPCAYASVFPQMDGKSLADLDPGGLFHRAKVITKDELESFASADEGGSLEKRLRRLFDVTFPFSPLTSDQVRTVRGVIWKEIVVRSRPAGAESLPSGQMLLPGARVLDVLDRDQEAVARSLGEGHRILFGVAGSGKTAMLLARARMLAEQDETRRILLLCYNTTLAAWLRTRLASEGAPENIEVQTFREWVRPHVPPLGRRPFEEREQLDGQAMLSATAGWPDDRKYDAILIDEAADFHPEWFTACVQALRGGGVGDLLLSVDGAQSVYKRPKGFTWKSVGVIAPGRSRQLGTNYRNTREIITFAWTVTQRHVKPEVTETNVRVTPNRSKRMGPRPAYRACGGQAEERDAILRTIDHYRSTGVAEEDICVVYARWEQGRFEPLVRALRQRFGRVSWTNDRREEFLRRPGVRMSTIHSAKGLEFPVVIVMAVDQLPNPQCGTEVEESNLLYVGLTRSIEHLVVTWAAPGLFTERVVASEHADPLVF
jgi:hypothetical protein